MHHFILVIEVLRETACRHILDFSLKDFRDGVSHLLEDVKEEHEFVLALLPVRHVLVEFVDGRLQLLILLKDFPTLITLPFEIAAIAIEEKVKHGLIGGGRHLFLKHQTGSLLMFHNLVLKVFDLVIPFIDLLSHLLNVDPCLILVSLQVLDMLLSHLKLLLLLLYDLCFTVVFHMTLLELVLFGKDHSRDPLVDLAQ